jgi:hypothetical protein
MPIANVIDLAGISADNMDLYEHQYLRTVSDPPPGLLAYVVGVTGEVIRAIEVWDSEEARDAFYQNRVGPATDAYLDEGLPGLTDEVDSPLTVRAFYCAGPAAIEPSSS